MIQLENWLSDYAKDSMSVKLLNSIVGNYETGIRDVVCVKCKLKDSRWL